MRIQIGRLDVKFGDGAGDAIRSEPLSDRAQNAQLPVAPQGSDPFPFKPLAPLPPLGGPGPEPTGFEIPVGYNLTFNPDQKKPGARNSQLRLLADNCWAIRIVIEDLKKQMRGLAWDVQPDKLNEGEDYEDLPGVNAARLTLKRPDGYLRFGDWLNCAMEEVLVIGSLALGKRRTVGGKTLGLRVLDAAKIAPILTPAGLPPPPPAPAFYQYLHGLPERQYTTDDLIWRPFNSRSWTPYGFSPVEQCLTLVTLAMNTSLANNYHFTAGNTPPGWLTMPKGWTTQNREDFQEYLDSRMRNNLQGRAAAIAVADGTTYTPVPPPAWNYEFEEFILRAMAWCVGVSPEAIMKSNGLGKGGDTMQTASQAAGIKPFKLFVEEILDEYLVEDLGHTDLTFSWVEAHEANKTLELEASKAFVDNGTISRNEARKREGLPPSDIPEMDVPMIRTATGLVPVAGSGEPKEIPPALAPFAGKVNPPGAPGVPEPAPEGGAKPESEAGSAPPPPEKKSTQKADLARWRSVAKADAKRGRAPRPFASAAITPAARFWVEKCLAAGDVAKAFEGPRRALRWETSERAKPLTEAGAALWQNLYSHLAAPWLSEAEPLFVAKAEGPVDMPSEDWDALVRWLQSLYVAGVDDSSELVGIGDTSARSWAEERAAALLGQRWDDSAGEWVINPDRKWAVSDSVRDQVREATARAIEEGRDFKSLASEMKDTLESEARAMVAARTETGFAYNMGAAANYAAQGVERVEVSDGNGPGSCEECDAVNGEEWTVEEMMTDPLGHPNCSRAFIPLPFEEEEAA